MIIFDYFFHTVYQFLRKRLKRNKEDAKHSALSIEITYISFFIPMIASIIGLIYDNSISYSFLNNGFLLSMIIGVISYIPLRIRYYKFYDVEDVEQEIVQLSHIRKQILKCLYYILLIGTPVLGFIIDYINLDMCKFMEYLSFTRFINL